MRASRLFIHTLREDPSEAELVSHRLMLRAGLIRQLTSGIFSWLPLGWRVVSKVANIVREEMNAAGAAEVMLPAVQPAEIWQASGRWQLYGPELLRLKDRHDREYCIGPTHEEVVTALAKASITSWRQLPFNLYQIQMKFRDEIRPRYGVMRAREFLMKDAYSFDANRDAALVSYQDMRDAYIRIFDRIGLDYLIVAADTGAIGGDKSEEFLVLANSGEAQLAYTDTGYAANLDQVPCRNPETKSTTPSQELQEIDTPGVETIDGIIEFVAKEHNLEIGYDRALKTMIVTGETGMAAVILTGDATLNLAKASLLKEIGPGARLAEPAEAAQAIGANFGSLGPVNMPLPVIADLGVQGCVDFCCGANKDGKHFIGVNFERDCPLPQFADLRLAKEGETAPDGEALQIRRGIEVGHIFYLGTKYSEAMGANFLHDNQELPIEMGCYGIGITRIVAAAIEQNHDDNGIIFPVSIAPFRVVVVALGKDDEVTAAATKLYEELQATGIDVLLDDRGLRAGAAFADLDLLGIPHRLIVSARGLKAGTIEHKQRDQAAAEHLQVADAVVTIKQLLN